MSLVTQHGRLTEVDISICFTFHPAEQLKSCLFPQYLHFKERPFSWLTFKIILVLFLKKQYLLMETS